MLVLIVGQAMSHIFPFAAASIAIIIRKLLVGAGTISHQMTVKLGKRPRNPRENNDRGSSEPLNE